MKKSLILILSLVVKFGFSQVNAGLIACYPLDCDNAADGGPNGLNGTLNSSGVTCNNGHLGFPSTSYHFGGAASDYIILPATGSPALLKPNTIAVSGWFQSDDLGQAYLVYTKNSCTYNFEAYALNFLAPGTFGAGSGGFYVTKSGPGCSRVQLFQNTNVSAGGDAIPAAGAWTHVYFCIDPSNITLYINGHLNTSMIHNIPWDYDTTRNVILGNTGESNFTQSFNGSIDNIRFYDRCLNIDEIEDLYNRDPHCKDPWKASNSVGITDYNFSNSNILSQNVPNPFNNETTINYSLPASVTNANIEVYDMVGKKMASYPVSTRQSSIKISSHDLPAGIYIYSIVGDGKIMDSKRMVLTN